MKGNLKWVIHALTEHKNLKYLSNKILPVSHVNGGRLCKHTASLEAFEHLFLYLISFPTNLFF